MRGRSEKLLGNIGIPLLERLGRQGITQRCKVETKQSLISNKFGKVPDEEWVGDIYSYLPPGRIWNKVFLRRDLKKRRSSTSQELRVAGLRFTRVEGQVQGGQRFTKCNENLGLSMLFIAYHRYTWSKRSSLMRIHACHWYPPGTVPLKQDKYTRGVLWVTFFTLSHLKVIFIFNVANMLREWSDMHIFAMHMVIRPFLIPWVEYKHTFKNFFPSN